MTKALRIPNNWAPRPYQMNVWRYLERGGKRAICIWRRGSRQGRCLLYTGVRRGMIDKPGSYWHMLPAYSHGRNAIWTSVNPHTGKRRIDEAFPIELRVNTNEQESPNGAPRAFICRRESLAQRQLVTSGAYAYVRHPVYTGIFVTYLGLIFRWYSPVNLAAVIILSGLWIIKSFIEESFLKSDPVYAEYMRRVKFRWFPRIA